MHLVAIICGLIFFRIVDGWVYTTRSNWGMIFAVAVPLDLGPNKNVYVAINFEVNYGLPSNNSHKELIEKWNFTLADETPPSKPLPIGKREVSRENIFKTFIGHLENYGFNGTGCLLRTICEIVGLDLGNNNGVLGSIMNVLFLPTASSKESGIANYFYEAEHDGLTRNCDKYIIHCPKSPLELVSKYL